MHQQVPVCTGFEKDGVSSEGSWSSTAPVEGQLEYVLKAASARKRMTKSSPTAPNLAGVSSEGSWSSTAPVDGQLEYFLKSAAAKHGEGVQIHGERSFSKGWER